MNNLVLLASSQDDFWICSMNHGKFMDVSQMETGQDCGFSGLGERERAGRRAEPSGGRQRRDRVGTRAELFGAGEQPVRIMPGYHDSGCVPSLDNPGQAASADPTTDLVPINAC
jgi:hypothetical protein